MSDAYREIFDVKTGEIRREPNAAARAKPWVFKAWEQMTESDRVGLSAHFATFTNEEDMIGYKKYLRDWCSVPADWLGIPQKS